jgi:hypothetical protein
MYDLIKIALIFGAMHVAFVWAAIEGLGLTYPQLLAANAVSSLLSALFAQGVLLAWRDRFVRAFRAEEANGELAVDLLMALAVFVVAGAASAVIIARRFGAVGWLGAVGVAIIAGAAV